MKRPTIPETDSVRELAAFWDKHDVTEFDGQLEEVRQPVFEPRGRKVAITFGLVEVPVEVFPTGVSDTRDQELLAVDGRLEIECFVRVDRLPPPALPRCRRLGPGIGGKKAYRLLVEGMKAAGCGAVIRAPRRGEGRTFLLRLFENTLILERVKTSRATIPRGTQEAVDFKPGEIDLARQLIEQLLVEEYDPPRRALAEPSSRKRPIRTPTRTNVVRLDDWIARGNAPVRNRASEVKPRRKRRAL